MCHIQWFFRKPDDEKLKRNEEGDVDLYSEPSLCLSLLSFFPCIIGLAEEPYFITSHLDAIALFSWRRTSIPLQRGLYTQEASNIFSFGLQSLIYFWCKLLKWLHHH